MSLTFLCILRSKINCLHYCFTSVFMVHFLTLGFELSVEIFNKAGHSRYHHQLNTSKSMESTDSIFQIFSLCRRL